MSPTVSLVAPSLAATHAVAAAIAACCRAGDIVVLAGEMGAGKTAFAQGFGKALGVDEPITSPTFTLVQSYDTPRGQFHHADVYRLDQLHEVADLALAELAEFRGIVVVEWGDVVSAVLGEHLEVRLALVAEPVDDDSSLDVGDAELLDVGDAELLDVGDAELLDVGDAELDDHARRITVTPSGRSWAERWQRLAADLDGLDLTATRG